MGKIKIPYYVVRNGRGYWQPKSEMKRLGFVNVACGNDGPDAWRVAEKLNLKWLEFKAEDEKFVSISPKRGSLHESFKRYQATNEWRKKAPRTREEWERAWSRIEPIFGDAAPKTITLEHISLFRENIALDVSEREAHRCVKIWRALWKVAAAFGYCKGDEDPSLGVRNTEPKRRQVIWSHSEVRCLVKAAWRKGYYGLATIIAISWDSSLSPVDVRKLTPSQGHNGPDGMVFILERAKTGRAAVATLSHTTKRILNRYIQILGVEIAPSAPLLRNRSGKPYTKDTLGDDFRTIRSNVFGHLEQRTLADFRRSGAVEAIRGGANTTHVGQKLANDAGSNPSLGRTYMPVDIQAVRVVDLARRKGRK